VVLNRDVELWKSVAGKLPPGVRTYLLKSVDLDNPPEFVPFMERTLVPHLRAPRDNMAKMLLERGVLVSILSDPQLIGYDEASAVMRFALAADPHFDILMLRHLTDPARSWPDDISSAEMMRVLDLLRAVGGIKRHMLILMRRFLRVPDPQVRSRAVRLVTASYPAYIETAIADPDPRVRSNLLEAVCEGLPKLNPSQTNLLMKASTDSNHRVATSGLYYLALHGDEKAAAELKLWLRHPAPAHRRAAAWALVKLSETQGSENSSIEPELQSELAAAMGPSTP